MCTICGTLLGVRFAPGGARARTDPQPDRRGKTKDEIKDALVAQYGPNVLATPGDTGST